MTVLGDCPAKAVGNVFHQTVQWTSAASTLTSSNIFAHEAQELSLFGCNAKEEAKEEFTAPADD